MLSDNIFLLTFYAGVLRIDQITFDMSLSINYSDLEPQIPQLTEFFARELDVNTSQVRYKVSKLHKIYTLNYPITSCLMKFLEMDVMYLLEANDNWLIGFRFIF